MKYFEKANILPKNVLAGDSLEITVHIVLGREFSANNSRLVFDFPGYLGYTRPTCANPEDAGFVEVICSNPEIVYEKKCWNLNSDSFETSKTIFSNRMAQRFFVLDFLGGTSKAGDEIQVKWGFTRDGFGVGTKIGTIVPQPEFYNTVYLRYFKEKSQALPDYGRSFPGYERPVPDEEIGLKYRVFPREPEKMRLIRQEKENKLLVLDRFSNICIDIDAESLLEQNISAEKNTFGAFIIHDCPSVVTSKKHPLLQTPDMQNVYKGKNIYFGDLHTHSAFSNDCIERERMEITPDGYFAYARQAAALDFLAVTDHHVPWGSERRKIGQKNWDYTCEAVLKNNISGEFLAFAGFEGKDDRGDTAVVLGEPFSYNEINSPDMTDIKTLWEKFKDRNYITIPHLHNPGNLNEGQWYNCPYEGVETILEIYSCHGDFETLELSDAQSPLCEKRRADRNGRALLDMGYRYGLICNSDGHKGNPGKNGLTAVYAEELTNEAILDAIRHRHVYGTTNARIRLLFTVNGKLMGSFLKNEERKQVYLSVCGENRIKSVDIILDGCVAYRYLPNALNFEKELMLEGTHRYCYVRVTQVDNHKAYSSPIWFD
jgi:hypothetical protein